MREAVIITGVRTPFGKFMGSLTKHSAVQLASHVAKGTLDKAGVDAREVDQVIFGNVIQSSQDAIYLARHAGLNAGVPIEKPAHTLNRLCGSGLEAIESNGELLIRSEEYGADQSFTVVSDVAGAGQTGIGTTEQSDTGVDVAGLINGRAAIGNGQILKGAVGSDIEGLELLASTTSPTTISVNSAAGRTSMPCIRLRPGLLRAWCSEWRTATWGMVSVP